MLDPETHWSYFCKELGIPDAKPLYHTHILPAYSQPHRHYHTMTHIEYCLHVLHDFVIEEQMMTDPNEWGTPGKEPNLLTLELAIWFHDYVYDPKSKTNEADSVDQMEKLMTSFGLDPNIINDAADLIDLTAKHNDRSDKRVNKLMLDIDLSILADRPEDYWKYEVGIQKEYSFVPFDLYCSKRAEILQTFWEQAKEGSLFRTRYFDSNLSPKASLNLAHALAYLRAQ